MKLNPTKTALLTMDLQGGIFEVFPPAGSVVPLARSAVEFARSKGFLVIHIAVGFSEAYAEVSPRHPRFLQLSKMGLFLKGTPSSAIHADLLQAGELIIYKHRVSAFHENQLDLILRSRGIENLVMFGISTSGVVLSTLRRASDLNYNCLVLKDACLDQDDEVHRVLTEKIFPAQGKVQSVAEFIEAQS